MGDAFLHETAADAAAAGIGLDVEKPQLGNFISLLDQKDRADDAPVHFRNPRALLGRIEILHELGADLGDERLERDVPSVLGRVKRAMPMDDPANVAGA